MKDQFDRLDFARKQLGLSFASIGKLLNISGDAVRKGIVDRKNLKPNYIALIIKHYDISPEWLESGEGEMLKENGINTNEDKKKTALKDLHRITKNKKTSEGRIIDESQLVPVHQYIIPLKGQAGLRKAFFYPDEYINTNFEREVIYVKPEERAVYYKIEVDGNSMVGKLDPGDWTRCEDIPKMYWIEKGTFKPERIYCLIHRTRGILFKRISKMHNENITLTSDNPDKAEYPDETFDLNEFSKIMIVRKIEKDA